MFSAFRKSFSLALFHAGPRLPLSLLRSISLCLPVASFLSSGWVEGADVQFASVRSYGGNFLVTAPDAVTAGWVAKVAELTRERTFRLLDYTGEWRRAADIHLWARTSAKEKGELELWTISSIRKGVKILDANVYPNKWGDAVVLQVVRLCVEDMASLHVRNQRPPGATVVPISLSCGIAENLSPANIALLREFAREIIREERFLPLEKLFQAHTLPSREAQRELFFKESGSVVDFLLHQNNGPSRLTSAIVGLAAQTDFKSSLLTAFGEDFVSIGHVQQEWKDFVMERSHTAIDAPRISLLETKQALDSILVVKIPVIDSASLQEKVIETDFKGLVEHHNRRVARQIASEKASLIFRLSLRSSREYAPVLQEYLLALTAVVNNQRREFTRHFSRAEKLREKLEQFTPFREEKAEDVHTPDQ